MFSDDLSFLTNKGVTVQAIYINNSQAFWSGMEAYTYKPSTRETEPGLSEVIVSRAS